MPFNEKGEFIRAPARSSRPRPANRRKLRRPSRRPIPQATATAAVETCVKGVDLATIVIGLVTLVLVVGLMVALVWLVVAFREWLLLSLVLWSISQLRKLLG